MIDGKVFALFTALCFGVNPLVLKAGLRASRSDVGVLVGLLSGLPVLMILAPALGGFHFEQLTGPAILYFMLGGPWGVFLGRTFLYLGVERLGSARTITIKNAAPVISAVLALVFLHELVSFGRWLGIVAVAMGLMLVGGTARQQANPIKISGLVFAALAAVSYGIRPIFTKLGLSLAPTPLTATLIAYLTASTLYLGYFLVKRQLASLRTDRRSLSFFALAGVLQAFGLLSLNYAIQRGDVTVVYPISASAPLVTFGLSYTILKNVERLTFWDLSGMTAVVVGVTLLLI